jgi:membrane protein DedA with SNARE-associated domain
MGFESLVHGIIDFVRDHQVWAAPIVFALAFSESLAFMSLLIPGWAALVGIGALIGASGISFWPVWLGGALGAACGDWLSFWVGSVFKHRIARMWPMSRYPEMLPRAENFVQRWGVPGIFLGRFFGPLRAFVPLAAGIFEMRFWPFQLANFSSALVWAAVLLAPGSFVLKHLL